MEHTTHTNNEEQAIDLSVLLRRMLRHCGGCGPCAWR